MNIELAIKAVQINTKLYNNLPRSTKEDVSFTLKILENGQCDWLFRRIPYCIRNNIVVVENVLSRGFREYEDISYELRNDVNFVLKYLKDNPQVFIHAGDDVKANKEITLLAVQKFGMNIKYVNTKYQFDREIVNAAVKQTPSALARVVDEMKYDRNMIIGAIKAGASLLDIPKGFIHDEEIYKIYIARHKNVYINELPLKYFSQHYNILKNQYSDEILDLVPTKSLNNRVFIKLLYDVKYYTAGVHNSPIIRRNHSLYDALVNKYPQLIRGRAVITMSGREFMDRYPHIKLYAWENKGHHSHHLMVEISDTTHNVMLYPDSILTFNFSNPMVDKCLVF